MPSTMQKRLLLLLSITALASCSTKAKIDFSEGVELEERVTLQTKKGSPYLISTVNGDSIYKGSTLAYVNPGEVKALVTFGPPPCGLAGGLWYINFESAKGESYVIRGHDIGEYDKSFTRGIQKGAPRNLDLFNSTKSSTHPSLIWYHKHREGVC